MLKINNQFKNELESDFGLYIFGYHCIAHSAVGDIVQHTSNIYSKLKRNFYAQLLDRAMIPTQVPCLCIWIKIGC